jgi:nitrite reductase/ring-hydroxylating ferredoxin subunit
MSDTSHLVPLCNATDVTKDTPARGMLGGQAYAIFNRDGLYYVTQDLCTHGPGFLSEGFVEDCEVECPFHLGRFNFITGAPTSPPCTEALRVWTVHLVDGKICIDPEDTHP